MWQRRNKDVELRISNSFIFRCWVRFQFRTSSFCGICWAWKIIWSYLYTRIKSCLLTGIVKARFLPFHTRYRYLIQCSVQIWQGNGSLLKMSLSWLIPKFSILYALPPVMSTVSSFMFLIWDYYEEKLTSTLWAM